MLKKFTLAFGVIMMAALFYGAHYFSAAASAGSGFSAKNICSGHFLSGMTGQTIVEQALVPASALLSNISFDIDTHGRQVDTRLFGFFHRRAVFSEGTGCTLLTTGHEALLRDIETMRNAEPDETRAWPQGSAAPSINRDLEPLLERAFSEPDPEKARNAKAVVVIHKGQLVAERYAQGITPDTPLTGWSMSKSVTNLLIGLLVHEGRLALKQKAPVAEWHVDPDDPRGEITIDQLLRMSSGLEFNEEYGLYSDVTRMLAMEPDAAGFATSKPLYKTPGSLWAYSSGTTNILSGIIKQTVGGSLQEHYNFAWSRLFLPLGVRTASMETDNNGTYVASSFMYASARDWARLGQFCLQDGYWQGKQLLPDGWMDYSTTPTATHPRNNYGAHFWLNADPEEGHGDRTWPALPADTYSMNGFQGQLVIVVPSADLVVVRLGFSATRNRGIEQLVGGIIGELAR